MPHIARMYSRGVGGTAVRAGLATLATLVLGVTACGQFRETASLRRIDPPTSEVPAAPADAPATPSPRTFTVLGSGDVLLHDGLWTQARHDAQAHGGTGYDFAPMFSSVKRVVSA